MAAGQGMRRISAGIVRPLTRFEVERGYFYLSRDRRLREILAVDDFDLDFCGTSVRSRHIDRYGRFQIPRDLMKEVPEGQLLAVTLPSRRLLRIQPPNASPK